MKCLVSRLVLGVFTAAWMLALMGCSSGSSTSPSNNNPTPQPQNGTMNVIVSDDPTEDWATIGVKILSISLTPQSGGNPVTVFTAASPAPCLNLLQLDQLSEILATASVPPGTYTAAQTVTISTGTPGATTSLGASAYTLDPAPGRWTLIIEFADPVEGNELFQPYAGDIVLNAPSAAAPALPDSAATALAA